MTTPTGSLEPETLVHNRYRVVQQIGRGGMGAVYEAIDTRLGNTVALKQTLVRGAQLDNAFAHEARLLSSLRHAALPVVSDYFADGDSHFLVMQFIPGTDFGALLAQRSAPFSFGEVLPWADSLLDALDYLHTQHTPIVHRDIKPQNLKLTPRGEIVLLDFGLAKGGTAAGATQVAGASLYGYTPQYAPLEQIQASGTDPRSDLYSLAATLHALLANAPPANALDRAAAVFQGQPDPLQPLNLLNPQVPAAVSQLLMRCMALNAANRPASAAAVRAELASAVRGGSAGASTAGMTTITAPTMATANPRQAGPPPLTPGSTGAPAQGAARSGGFLLIAVVVGLVVLLVAALGLAIVSLVGNVAQLNPGLPSGPPIAATIEERDPPVNVPPIVLPTMNVPDIGATVGAVQTSVAASLPPAFQNQETDPNLATRLLEFGQEGSGDGFLQDPRNVAVGPDGAIYLADFVSRVQRFSAAGVFERSWLLEDDRPILSIAADRQGFIYVSQNSQVSKFEGATGKLVDTFSDADGNGFEDLVILGDGSMLGLPWAGRDIVRLDAAGNEVGRISDPMAAADSDGSPTALAADGLGTIYLLDGNNNKVYVFSAEGKFRDTFSTPSGWAFSKLAVDGQGRIYTTGFPGGVQVFDGDGRQVGSIAVTGVAFDLAFDGENNLYACTNTPLAQKFTIAPQQ